MKSQRILAVLGSLLVLGAFASLQPAVQVTNENANGTVKVTHQDGHTTVKVTEHGSTVVNMDPPYPGI